MTEQHQTPRPDDTTDHARRRAEERTVSDDHDTKGHTMIRWSQIPKRLKRILAAGLLCLAAIFLATQPANALTMAAEADSQYNMTGYVSPGTPLFGCSTGYVSMGQIYVRTPNLGPQRVYVTMSVRRWDGYAWQSYGYQQSPYPNGKPLTSGGSYLFSQLDIPSGPGYYMAQASIDFHYDNTYNHGSYGKVNMYANSIYDWNATYRGVDGGRSYCYHN
jgi:hypothetical protein